MAIIKCKMCGGDIELSADKTYGTCDSCGSTMTFPKVSDEQRANLFNRANHFRRQNEFDKAIAAYERILDEDNTDAEAHWGVVLSRYGIEYVEDPVSHERIPTCHRVQLDSVLVDADYLAAVEHAPDGYSRSLYEREAARIAEIQKDILTISNQENPYDVFICYKETTDGGNRTKDSTLAQDIYYQLTQDGYKVFFSRITLEDKLGQQYEPYIFAALNSAKVMVVVGTKPDHFNAVWVKNEWSRYLALMKKDRKRLLIPCYLDMNVYDLPDELSALQSQDMSKIGFMQDLIRGIKKVLDCDKTEKSAGEQAHAPSVVSLLKRARLFLEDGDFTAADEYAEKVLDIDPECAEAYLVKTLADGCYHNEDELTDSVQTLEDNLNYTKALRFANAEQKTIYFGYEQKIRNNIHEAELELAYQQALELYQIARDEQGFLKAAQAFAELNSYKDAQQYIASSKNNANQKRKEYDAMQRELEIRAEQERIRRKQETEERAAKQAQAELERKRREEQKRIEETKQRKKRQKFMTVIAIVMVVICAAGLFFTNYVLPKLDYDKATVLLNEQKYDEAIEAFAALDGWGDSNEQVKASYYAKANLCFEQNDLDIAREYYLLAEPYANSNDQIKKINAYQSAVALFQMGQITAARNALTLLSGFLDADDLYQQCCAAEYTSAINLECNGNIAEAYELFVGLGDYADSKQKTIAIELNYRLAGELLASGRYDEAAATYAQLGNYADSKNQWRNTLLQKAEALFSNGQYNEAATQFEAIGESERALASKEAEHAMLCGMAEEALNNGQYDEAIARFTVLNEIERASAARYAKAESLLQSGDHFSAEVEWELLGSYRDTVNRLFDLRMQIAAEALKEKDYGTALTYYFKLPQTDEVKAKEYTVAQAAYDTGAFEQAVLAYEALGTYQLSISKLPVARYAYASQLFENEEYEKAAEQFNLLNGSTDSTTRAQEAIYCFGKKQLEQELFDLAKGTFIKISGYQDTDTLIKECDYRKADGLMLSGNHVEARLIFDLLDGYSESAERAKECGYLIAEAELLVGNYSRAQREFESLGAYKDSVEKGQLCIYEQANDLVENGNYIEAEKMYASVSGYKDSDEQVMFCRYEQGKACFTVQDYTKALNFFADLDYDDSKMMAAKCHYKLGEESLSMGDTDDAVCEYAQAIILPEAQEMLYSLGKDFASINELVKAIEALWAAGDNKEARNLIGEIAELSRKNGNMLIAYIGYAALDDLEECDLIYPHITLETLDKALNSCVIRFDDNLQNAVCYGYALQMRKNNRFDEAKALFGRLPVSYLDAAAQVSETVYQKGLYELENVSSRTAYLTLGEVSDYEPAHALLDSDGRLILEKKTEQEIRERFAEDKVVQFGTYDQIKTRSGKEPIEWLVLKCDKDKALLISKYILDEKYYNSENFLQDDWRESEVRIWLNQTFLTIAFSQEEQKVLGSMAGDFVSLLTKSEIERYFPSETSRKAIWLDAKTRPVGTWMIKGMESNYVDSEGSLKRVWDTVFVGQYGVRPVVTIDLCAYQAMLEKVYQQGEEQLERGDSTVALKTFKSIAGFKDADERIAEIYSQQAQELLEQGKNEEAYDLLRGISDNPKASALITSNSALSNLHQKWLKTEENFAIGEVVLFGKYHEQDIEWIVLQRDGTAVLLMSKYVLYEEKYGTWDYYIGGQRTLSPNLDQHFQNKVFTSSEWSSILKREYVNDKLQYVFLLTEEQYNLVPRHERAGFFKETNEKTKWWLREEENYRGRAPAWATDGKVYIATSADEKHGVRPAIWLDLSSYCRQELAKVDLNPKKPSEVMQ